LILRTPDTEASPVEILLLSDGRPGHYRQSEGVIAAIERHRPVSVTRLELKSRLPLPKAMIPKLSRRLPPRVGLKLLYAIDANTVPRPDLIVSAGGMTLGANVGLARTLATANVFCGAIRGFPIDAFGLVLTDNPSEVGIPEVGPPKDQSAGGLPPRTLPSNVRVGPKPATFDPDTLPPPAPLVNNIETADIHVGLLVGGATDSADFEASDWQALAMLVQKLITEQLCHITIVTSPRTPPAAYTAFEKTIASFAGNCTLVDFRQTGPGSIDKALASDILLVTSDSMSMMTEAALSQRPAIALRPARTAPTRDDAAIAWLTAQGWLAILNIADTSTEALFSTARALRPMTENHLDRLAGFVLPLLGSKG